MRRKAFALSLDAILALVIAGIMVTVIFNSQQTFHLSNLGEEAFDALAVADAKGLLKDYVVQENVASINQTLSMLKPRQWHLQIDSYKYAVSSCGACNLDSSSQVNGFCHCKSQTITSTTSNATTAATAKRMAYLKVGKEEYFVIALLKTWSK